MTIFYSLLSFPNALIQYKFKTNKVCNRNLFYPGAVKNVDKKLTELNLIH